MSEHSQRVTGWRIGIILALFVSAFMLQYYYSGSERQWFRFPWPATAGETAGYLKRVQLITNYLKCGHSLVTEEEMEAGRLAELLAGNPELALEEREGATVLIATEEGFCPHDEEQRYLGIQGEYLAVFRGPVGKGELERITQIRVDLLPQAWQQQLLEGKLVFEDEVSLLEALDSLDEYQS